MFRQTVPCFTLYLLSLVLSLGSTGSNLAKSSLHTPFRYVGASMRFPPQLPSLLWAKQSQLSQLFLTGEMLQSLTHLCAPLLDSLVSQCLSCAGEPRTRGGGLHSSWNVSALPLSSAKSSLSFDGK